MKLILYIVILTFYIATSNSSVFNNIKNDVLSYLKRSVNDKPSNDVESSVNKVKNEKNQIPIKRKQTLFEKAKMLKEKKLQNQKYYESVDDTKKIGNKKGYALDPVLNFLKRRTDFRRKKSSSTDLSSSSSLEMKKWKDEWRENWVKKKFEAFNISEPRGDVVNMVAARPWGVPCGDPNQHDMPWGSCMLPMECEPEYRIYRGDYFCGRTQFICCALQLTNYDMYQGFDVSFDDSGLSTDSEEKRNQGKGSKEKRKRRKRRERKKRRRDRQRRKRKIKRNIRKIIREIRKILNRAYRNGTTARKKKTIQLKKFVKELKKRYKKDRHSVKEIHEMDLLTIDSGLQAQLNQIKDINQNFMKNSTFRDIIMNRTITRQGARMLVEAYPELQSYFADNTRRSGLLDEKDPLDYDIEYGMLYY